MIETTMGRPVLRFRKKTSGTAGQTGHRQAEIERHRVEGSALFLLAFYNPPFFCSAIPLHLSYLFFFSGLVIEDIVSPHQNNAWSKLADHFERAAELAFFHGMKPWGINGPPCDQPVPEIRRRYVLDSIGRLFHQGAEAIRTKKDLFFVSKRPVISGASREGLLPPPLSAVTPSAASRRPQCAHCGLS
jgi:hypothetical protein